MGSSAPAAIDYVDSHARLRGSEVEVVLCGLAEDVGDRTALVLSRAGSTISAPAQVQTTGDTRELRARTPRRGLSDGYWTIALAADESLTIDARLLVQGARPVVLVLGATAPPSVVPAKVVESETLTTGSEPPGPGAACSTERSGCFPPSGRLEHASGRAAWLGRCCAS